MSTVLITPNMNLPNPIPSTTPGPEWAFDIAACLGIVDGHNHSAGQGVPIQPNGLDINDDLPFNSNNATLLRAVRFEEQASPIVNTGDDVGELFVSGNELYYNDVSGSNTIQITNNGSVNAGAGSISGLPSGTASAAYNAGTFTWQSATNVAATMDAGPYIMRNLTASSFGITLQAPTLGSSYSLTFPTVPVATKIMSLDSSGNMGAVMDVDNVTLQIASNVLSVKNLGIDTAQLANGSVTRAKLASNILQENSQTFNSSGSFVVPSNVTTLEVEGCGGGGGGGGGGSTVASSGGGGGGAGCLSKQTITVTAGDTLAITVGGGGNGGAAASVGVSGTSSTVVNGAVITLATFQYGGGGGLGSSGAAVSGAGIDSIGAGGPRAPFNATYGYSGGGGGGGGSLGNGGDPSTAIDAGAGAQFSVIGTAGTNGGGGGGGEGVISPATVGLNGGGSVYQLAGGSGGTAGTGAGGGGGGSAFGIGGAGGNGANTPTVGANAAANSGGGGGGGGGSGDAGAGAAGGNGGSGKIIIRWLGAT